MKNFLSAAILAIVCFAFKNSVIKILIQDFNPAFGKWEGSLTYLDYKSGKPYTMPANATISPNNNNDHQLVLAYAYPNEPKANGNDTLTINKSQTGINKSTVTEKHTTVENTTEIITEENGKDGNDNKLAIIKHTYTISKKIFSIRKDVKFKGEEKWILRSTYSFKR